MAKWEKGDFDIMNPIEFAKEQMIAIAFLIERQAKINQTDFPYVDTGRSRASISVNTSENTGGKQLPDTFSIKDKKTGRTQEYQLSDDVVRRPTATNDKEFIVVVGSNVEYFPYIELGTKIGLKPGRMLTRAYDKYKYLLKRLGSIREENFK